MIDGKYNWTMSWYLITSNNFNITKKYTVTTVIAIVEVLVVVEKEGNGLLERVSITSKLALFCQITCAHTNTHTHTYTQNTLKYMSFHYVYVTFFVRVTYIQLLLLLPTVRLLLVSSSFVAYLNIEWKNILTE